MATFTKVFSFTEALAHKLHDLETDTLTVALTTNANAPTTATTQLSDLTEVSYTNCSARAITTTSSAQTGGTYKLVLTDLTLTASGGTVGPFQWVTIYNDTAANDEVLGFMDYGSEITLNDTETLLIDFDPTNGVFTIV
jgi:hypothetical protein